MFQNQTSGLCQIISVLFVLKIVITTSITDYSLKNVVVLGRHNIRTPLISNLSDWTTHEWPEWDQPPGHLTPKGGLLEQYMGEYFSQWLKERKLLSEDCPTEKSVFIYSNYKERTQETARKFIETAFKRCNITVHYEIGDIIFFPNILNATKEFQLAASQEIRKGIDKIDLTEAYALLQNILDLNHSKTCQEDGVCDFYYKDYDIILRVGDEPRLDGPIVKASVIVDALFMELYNGMPETNVAWGLIRHQDWEILLKILLTYNCVRFGEPIIANDISKPMTDYLANLFSNDMRNFTLLVGHDATIIATLERLHIKPYKLPNQYEDTPIGGKVVFQKWWNAKNSSYFLKMEYVYQTIEQILNATVLSLENPPASVILELSNCKIDENGFCPWEDFITILANLPQ